MNNENDDNQNHNSNQNDSFIAHLSVIDLETLLYVGSMICYYLTQSIQQFKSLAYDQLNNYFFQNVFHLATVNFAFGMIVYSTNIPKKIYFIYMIPQAVLWSLGALISYYVQQQNTGPFQFIRDFFGTIFASMNLGKVLQYIFTFKGERKMKIILVVSFCVMYLWFVFLTAIPVMNNGSS